MPVSESFVIQEFGKSKVDSPISSSGIARYFIVGETLRIAVLNTVDFVDFFKGNLMQRQIRDNRYRSPTFLIST